MLEDPVMLTIYKQTYMRKVTNVDCGIIFELQLKTFRRKRKVARVVWYSFNTLEQRKYRKICNRQVLNEEEDTIPAKKVR